MASAREIQNRIKSIQDTMKITRAMYMMSSMKLRKAKQKLADTDPYFYALQEQISSILYHFPNMQHLFFDNRDKDMLEEVKKKAFIVITSDKGMAGAYNHNVLKVAQELCEQSEAYKLFVVGEIGRHYFKSRNYPVVSDFRYSAANPSIHRARVITEEIVELYKQEEIDEVYVIYTRMVNSMKEEVEVERLLPLKTHSFIKNEMLEEAKKKHGHMDGKLSHETDGVRDLNDSDDHNLFEQESTDISESDYLIYPSPKKVLKRLVYNYVTGFLYGVLVVSTVSEENARMLAMQAATDNAQMMLQELSIQYNRVRQAAITQEITEVIGGAKALKKKKNKLKQAR